MNRLLTTALMSATLLLAACGGGGSHDTGESLVDIVKAERGITPAANTCMVPDGLIGQPNSELAKIKFKTPIRVIYPGTVVSADHIANRINFKVDKKGVIRDITCG